MPPPNEGKVRNFRCVCGIPCKNEDPPASEASDGAVERRRQMAPGGAQPVSAQGRVCCVPSHRITSRRTRSGMHARVRVAAASAVRWCLVALAPMVVALALQRQQLHQTPGQRTPEGAAQQGDAVHLSPALQLLRLHSGSIRRGWANRSWASLGHQRVHPAAAAVRAISRA